MDGTLWTTGRNNYGQLGLGDNAQRYIWTQVSGSDWDYVECGYNYTLAVKTDGSLYGCGYNSYGQLGLDDTTHRNVFTLISAGWLHSGYRSLPQFSGGACHSLAIDSSTILKATGRGSEGQLGIGTGEGPYNPSNKDLFTETDESFDNPSGLPVSDEVQDTWDHVVCGKNHTMALKIITPTTIYSDDDEPQIWSLPTKGPSL